MMCDVVHVRVCFGFISYNYIYITYSVGKNFLLILYISSERDSARGKMSKSN